MATITEPLQATRTVVTRRASAPRIPVGLLFTLPFLLFYAAFLLWPVLYSIFMGFTNESLAGARGEFIGLRNWQELFGDAAMWSALWHTVYFTLLSTPPLVLVGLVMALLTNRVMPARWLWRMSFFAPFLLPASVISLIWVWLYQPGFGLVNDTLLRLGLGEPGWLSNQNVTMFAIVITTVWWTVGFNFLLYLAALQSIPQELYDAAAIDGAGWWQRLSRITLPLLKRTTGLVIVLQLLASLKVFDQIYLMIFGGPNFATRPIIQYFFDTGFTGYRIGYASAISTFFFVLIVVASIALFKVFPSRPAQGEAGR